MTFFNTPIAALLLSLSLISSSAAATTIAEVPSSSPAPAPSELDAPFDAVNMYTVPMEEQASDKQYLKAHMVSAANKVEIFLSTEVEKKLNDPTIGESKKECLSVCKEVYESAVDAMKTGMESISSGDFIKANFDVSAFTTNIDTCDECFDDFKEFDGWAKGVGGDCLDKIVKYSN